MARHTLALRDQRGGVAMKIVTLLPHDERFSGWSIEEKLTRFHFSTQYLRFCKSLGWDPYLYCFHQAIKEKRTYRYKDFGMIKIFPVKFRFPPLLAFGNDHNPKAIQRELAHDQPGLVHFHHYYLFSFPYTVKLVKQKLKCPLTTQLHSYHHKWIRRTQFLPCLLSLKEVDRIFYSYKPEESLYRKLGVLNKAVRIPVPSVDPSIFKPSKRRDSENLLYVGRIPLHMGTYAEKSPILLLFILRKLLRYRNVKLTIIGDGPGLPYCQHLVSKLKIEKHVSFQGFTPRSRLPKHYQNAALTIIPLELYDIDGWFDGSIQESLACGTPVAAFKSSPKIPLKGSFGFLLPRDVEKAPNEILTLLDKPEALEETAQQGSQFVHAYCTEDKLIEKLRLEWEVLMRK